MVQGQPGPNMRAASFQAQQTKEQSSGGSFVMQFYTFAIVAFFIYTLARIVMKKVNKEPKTKPLESDPVFVERVIKQSQPDNKKKLGKISAGIEYHQHYLTSSYLPKRNQMKN